MPLTIWWTPTHYGDASAEEYTDIQRVLDVSGLFQVTLRSAKRGTYSETLGIQYGAFQLGWLPDYPDLLLAGLWLPIMLSERTGDRAAERL